MLNRGDTVIGRSVSADPGRRASYPEQARTPYASGATPPREGELPGNRGVRCSGDSGEKRPAVSATLPGIAVYPDRFRLPFLAGVLIAAAERIRPGLGPWSPQVEARLRDVFATELSDVRARFLELFDDPGFFDRTQETLLEVALPRYLAAAQKQTALEQRDYGLWRGGDLLARGVYALGGFALGLFLVKAPFIPIPTTWDLLAFAFLLLAPFLPEAQVWLLKRRYRSELRSIVEDLRDAEVHRELYQPLAAPQVPEELSDPARRSKDRIAKRE